MRDTIYIVDINNSLYQVATFKQFDNDIDYKIRLTENGVDSDLAGYTVKAFFMDSKKRVFQRNCTIEGSIISTKLDNNILSCAGITTSEFVLYKNDMAVATYPITLNVVAGIDRDEAIKNIPDWEIIKDIVGIKDIINGKLKELEKAIENIPTKDELVGEKGDKGDKGDIGKGLNIKGSFNSADELPMDAVLGDAYMVQ
ncbi:TPA: hypothetical protein KOQ35_003806, partial [Clostridioides difficile]|nr:hypothetical protein [Clostridioides difficile]